MLASTIHKAAKYYHRPKRILQFIQKMRDIHALPVSNIAIKVTELLLFKKWCRLVYVCGKIIISKKYKHYKCT